MTRVILLLIVCCFLVVTAYTDFDSLVIKERVACNKGWNSTVIDSQAQTIYMKIVHDCAHGTVNPTFVYSTWKNVPPSSVEGPWIYQSTYALNLITRKVNEMSGGRVNCSTTDSMFSRAIVCVLV